MFETVANAQPVTVDLSALSIVGSADDWTCYMDADGEPVVYVETATGLAYAFRDVLAAS